MNGVGSYCTTKDDVKFNSHCTRSESYPFTWVPIGTTSISFAIERVLASTSSCDRSMVVPNASLNFSGSTLLRRSSIAADSAAPRSARTIDGLPQQEEIILLNSQCTYLQQASKLTNPAIAAPVEASSMRPWMAPTYFDPNRSASYAGNRAYVPPKHVHKHSVSLTANIVLSRPITIFFTHHSDREKCHTHEVVQGCGCSWFHNLSCMRDK